MQTTCYYKQVIITVSAACCFLTLPDFWISQPVVSGSHVWYLISSTHTDNRNFLKHGNIANKTFLRFKRNRIESLYFLWCITFCALYKHFVCFSIQNIFLQNAQRFQTQYFLIKASFLPPNTKSAVLFFGIS